VADDFEQRIPYYASRVEAKLDTVMPGSEVKPVRLHEAMRYAIFNGGKRVRPLLVYAAGECLGVPEAQLDSPAAAIELIHAFSLVHDDLPAMDDDDCDAACRHCIANSTKPRPSSPPTPCSLWPSRYSPISTVLQATSARSS